MNNKALGNLAEFMARCYFRIKGYTILAKNLKTSGKAPIGEVDFIAKKGKTIIFAEVKKRQSIEKAKYAILPKQQKRIVNAAKIYIKNHPNYQNCNIRFDAVLVKFPFQILHIKNAWNENIYS